MNGFWHWVRCQLDQYAPDDCHQRIAKAREILEEELKHASGGYYPGFIQGVIQVLEEK